MEVMGLMLGEFVDECVLLLRVQRCLIAFPALTFASLLVFSPSIHITLLGCARTSYTIICVDVFAMPQSGTSVSVESVDPVFQTKMLEMLKAVNRCASRACVLATGYFIV